MEPPEEKFNASTAIPSIMAIGTWLFGMYQSYHGIHYVPDEWVIAVILSSCGIPVYSTVRDKAIDVIKRLRKD